MDHKFDANILFKKCNYDCKNIFTNRSEARYRETYIQGGIKSEALWHPNKTVQQFNQNGQGMPHTTIVQFVHGTVVGSHCH